jgi:Transcriptional regulator
VAAAGVSRRTFFRYFKSKEDVILEFVGEVGEYVRAELATRPVEEPPAQAIRHALSVAVAAFSEYPEKSIALTRLTLGTPALRARYLDRQDELKTALAAVLAERSGAAGPGDLRAKVTAGMALVVFNIALARWAEDGGTKQLDELFKETFALAADALN